MSCRNIGVYLQGAIIKKEDFDPVKVIPAVCEKVRGISLPDNIKKALTDGKLDRETGEKLCEILDIRHINIEEIEDSACIASTLLQEGDFKEWFEEPYNLMGSPQLEVTVINELEGDFIYDNSVQYDEPVENILMFSLNFPLVWNINGYISRNNYRSRGEVLRLIRKTAQPLLKDDIEWENRLGYLIGSLFIS